jgi:uncharacterized protein (DUF779 family)
MDHLAAAGSDESGGDANVRRVDVSVEAADMVRRLRAEHGPVMFHQSGGCCDGSSPMCYPKGDFLTGDADAYLGTIDVREPGAEGQPVEDDLVEVWMSAAQFAYWRHTHLTIDLVPGRGAGFSLEGPTGFRFLIRSRLFTDDEYAALGETRPSVGLVRPS